MTDFNVNGSNNNFEEYNNQNAKNENKAPEEKEALFEENENAPDEPKSDSVIIRKVDKTSREALEKFFSYKEGGEDKELFGMKVSDIINKLLNGGKQPTPQPDPRPNPVYAVPIRKSGSMYLLVTVLPRWLTLLLYSAYLSSNDMKILPLLSNI